MKSIPKLETCWLARRPGSRLFGTTLAAAWLVSVLLACSPAQAGSFSSDFNSGLPTGVAVYGASGTQSSGGFTNSGYLQLTPLVLSTNGAFILNNDLDNGVPVVGFVARFKAYMYSVGTGADGISFNFAPNLPAGTITEEGSGSGLTVEFDTYSNDTVGGTDLAGIDVKVGGVEYATFPLADNIIRPGTWVDVLIQLHPDNTLDVAYDGTWLYTNLNLANFGFPASVTGYRFGFGARTGGYDDVQGIDDLNITTYTNGTAFVDYYSPIGRNVRADAPIRIELTDFTDPVTGPSQVDTSKIALQLDGAPVVPSISRTPPTTVISYLPPALFAPGSTHTVDLTYADTASPTPNTNTWEYRFTVGQYSTLPTNLVADLSYVNLGSPGFHLRYSQTADAGSRDVSRAELQLEGLLIDGSTGLPYPNLAAPNPLDGTFTYSETNVINYGYPPGSTGDFPGDANVPGMPGPTTGNGNSYAMDAVTYLHLAPGLYTLGVNSSDGFKLTVADQADIFAPQEAIYSGVRAAADSTVSFAVAQDGYYPFRLVYFTGDPNYAPAPGTATPSVEFFSVTSLNQKILVNDTNTAGYVPAFNAAKTKPYVRSVNPNIGDTGVPGNTAVTATLVDGTLTVQTNTILLQINGATVAPTISSNAGVYTVSFQPAAVFPPNSSNYVTLAFTDSGSNRRTNSWSFTVANIMSPIWSIAAVNGTWVTAGSTERGLAYNPKTGHLILVSRAGSPAPANGLGIAILDSANGNVLGTMNIGDIATTGVGTFKLSMVDVADDGVIYVANLTTSATVNFRIYRWQNESAAPQLVWDGPPLGGASRCGDDFRVRGSGSGTQIIASGNSAVTTIPIFTTKDGTNFTGTALNISGIAANVLRLGLAWGCGNTFYGETTGTPMSYVGFNGLPSTAANLIASYGIYDKNTNQAIGPIGLDIANQRLIGNQTVSPHNINLYDLPSLAVTPTKNFPIDQRNYASQNTSFGTGSVDFSPDGSRVFCLDTGNGIIAFSLAPKVAPPSICAQPQNQVVDGPGSVGFMDVTAIGAPQTYQWRRNGVALPNATNRTLDIYNVQQSDLGFYSVVITNSLLSVTSSVAYLDTQMVITNQPASQLVDTGTPVTFTVGVSNGLPAYAYQWQFDGTNLTAANSSSYTIGSAQVTNAGAYTVAITDSLGQSITSQVAVLTVGVAGSGTGLAGDYYNVPAFTTSTPPDPFDSVPAYSAVDPTINFDWGTGVGPGVGADYFTVRWHGQVQPFYSQTYTFYTRSDDGSRLWVNGQLVVDSWFSQSATERSGTIALTANQKYDIVLEYFENTGAATVQLSWSSPSQYKQIIPMSQLYPSTGAFTPVMTTGLSNGTNLIINWTGTGILESAPVVTGPWTPITTNAGPFTVNVTAGPEMYFRLISQQSL